MIQAGALPSRHSSVRDPSQAWKADTPLPELVSHWECDVRAGHTPLSQASVC